MNIVPTGIAYWVVRVATDLAAVVTDKTCGGQPPHAPARYQPPNDGRASSRPQVHFEALRTILRAWTSQDVPNLAEKGQRPLEAKYERLVNGLCRKEGLIWSSPPDHTQPVAPRGAKQLGDSGFWGFGGTEAPSQSFCGINSERKASCFAFVMRSITRRQTAIFALGERTFTK